MDLSPVPIHYEKKPYELITASRLLTKALKLEFKNKQRRSSKRGKPNYFFV
jgi:hypothetical protein